MAANCMICGAALRGAERFCAACGAAIHPEPPLGSPGNPTMPPDLPGERRQVTVLFADFAGFTAFSEERDAEEVHDYMNALWMRLDAIIAAHGGSTEKHIGDAIMSVFGARQARETDPEQAVRAGLAMQRCLGQLAAERSGVNLQLRVGINTGLVVIGPVGVKGHLTITGDTVNLASRLEQSAPLGGVLVSQATYRHVYGLFDVRAMPPLQIRGKAEPVQSYVVLRARSGSLARTLRGIEGVENPMIGRERELQRLRSAFLDVLAKRQLQVVTVVGEAGIGKSCLLREFQKWVEMLPQVVRFFCGRAAEGSRGLPFSLMKDLICSRFEILESDPPSVAREKLQQGWLKLLGGSRTTGEVGHEAHLIQAHLIGQMIGLDFSDSPLLRGIIHDAEQMHHRAIQGLGTFFASVSQGSGSEAGEPQVKALLLVLEDIHWADDASLDLLVYLAGACREVPVLMVCLARPTLYERRPRWDQELPESIRVDLPALSRDESQLLVQTILGPGTELAQGLGTQIVQGAEGNPFFIEELIKMLIDQKVIVPEARGWRAAAARLANLRVPTTLTAVLLARLDGLTREERLVLQKASVIGRVFWGSVVERLAGGKGELMEPPNETSDPRVRSEAEATLALLHHKRLIFRRETSAFSGSVEYTFSHELLRNVAYETLLKKQRRRYHGEVASWLIEQSGERVSEYAGLVAAHFEHAERFAQAAEWYGRAGLRARTSYSPAIAIEHFRKALELLPAPSEPTILRPVSVPLDPTLRQVLNQRLEWVEGLGESLGAQARFVEAMEAYAEMRRLAEILGVPDAQARACNGLAFLHERQGDNRASVQAAEQAEPLARAAGPDGREALIRALYLKGWALYRLSQASDVLVLAEQTHRLCSESQDQRGLVNSYKLSGVAHLQLGLYAEADAFFRRGLKLCEELGEQRNAAAMWSNLGESARLRGDCETAAGLYLKALELARQIGHRESEVIYLSNLAGARLGLGQFAQAEADVRQVIALTGDPNSPMLCEAYTFLAEARLGQGNGAGALAAAQHAVTLGQASENYFHLGGAWRTLGQAAAKMATQGSGANSPVLDPQECFAESLQVLERIDAKGEQARTLSAWAELEQERGRLEAARQKLEAARNILAALAPDVPGQISSFAVRKPSPD